MKFNRSALAGALLASCTLSANALEAIQDEQLSEVSGQDGVSIVADLNVNVGSVVYGDNDAGDGAGGTTTATLNLNNIGVTGLVVATVDVLSGADFQAAAVGIADAYKIGYVDDGTGNLVADTNTLGIQQAVVGDLAAATGYVQGDVVQIAFPDLGNDNAAPAFMDISVGSIATGNGGASMGSLAVNDLDMGGTKVFIYGH